jgi:integrase/recombinase XerC
MDTPDFSQVDRFLRYLQFEKRYSAHTVRAYADDLRDFFIWLEGTFGKTSLAEISSPMVRSWLADNKDRGLAVKSINRKISSLKSFFKYMLVTGVLTKTPMTSVRSPRIPRKLPVYVQESEMEKTISPVEGFEGATQILIVEILYATGIRLSELIGIRELDFDLHTSTLKVLGKGKKERIIPVSAVLIERLHQYLKEKKAQDFSGGESYLLLTPSGKKLYPKYVYRAVKSYLAQITTLQKKSPHVLRHSFATHLTNNGAELNAVKELLGHASLAATQIYTHNSIEKLKEIHSRAHPKS